jgi:N-acetylneuraminic acid mutarotase
MSLTKKRVHLYEVKDGITYDEDVDVYTSTSAVTFDDGETLQDKLDTGFVNAEQLGNLDDLETEDKSNLVASLNEINGVVQSNDVMLNSGESEGGYAFAFGREVLDGSWKSVSTLPYNFANGGVVICNNEIHILGTSYSNTTYYTSHYKFNGTSWESVSTLPHYFYDGSAVVLNNEIHILGSRGDSSYYKYHYKYNGTTWESISTLPYNFYYGSAIIHNNEIHILGGYYNSNSQKYHYKYNGTSWKSVSTLPYNFYQGSSVVYNNEIHIIGSANTSYSTRHYKYNGTSWVSVSTLPYGFYYGGSTVLNNEIHILGSSYGSSYRQYHYKYDGSSWSSTSTLPYPFYNGSAVLHKNQIHILGGNGGSTSHYILNSGTLLSGYVKTNTQIYQPNSYPVSDNLTTLEDGVFEVTEDGLVEMILEE